MTLAAALSSANSSLRAIQTQLAVASSNIANADDVTYTAKTAQQTARVTSGAGTGVDVTAILSKVDANLVRGIAEATSASAATATTQDYLQRLSDALGTLASEGSGDTLATGLSTLESTLDELAATPESATLNSQALANLDDALASLRTASDAVAALVTDAETSISDAVTGANDLLKEIHGLNQMIIRARADGESTATLEDQRNAAVTELAEQLDVSYFVDSEGAMNVYTGTGQVLVASQVHELSLDDGAVMVNGKDITGALQSGTLAALVALRDDALPAVQADLDAMAVSLRDTLNAVSNQGSAVPPPTTLTGTRAIAATDTLSATGTLRVAVTDGDGAVAATADIDLTTIGTVADLLTALNGVAGLSASLDSSGILVLSATDGVAVSGGDVGGNSLSGYFGLNDLVSGSGASDLSVRLTTLPTGQMATTGTLAVGDTAVSVGSGALAQSMADAMRTADLTGQAGELVAGVGTALTSAKTRATSAETALTTLTGSFQSQYGVNVDEETARISELQNSYSASAQVLSAVQSMFDDLLNAVR